MELDHLLAEFVIVTTWKFKFEFLKLPVSDLTGLPVINFFWQKVIKNPWFSDFKMSAHWNFQILTTLDMKVRSSPGRLTNESFKFPAYGCLRSRRFSLDLTINFLNKEVPCSIPDSWISFDSIYKKKSKNFDRKLLWDIKSFYLF